MSEQVVRRAVLPAAAVALLAERAGASLPEQWVRPVGGAALLQDAGLVDAAGDVAPDVDLALAPLRRPEATVDLTLAPATATAVATATATGLAFTALLVVDDTSLVALLRRSGDDRVELTLGPATALPGAVRRLLEQVGGPAAPAPISLPRRDFAALDDVRRTLAVTVLGDRSLASPPVGLLLLVETADGWREVEAEGQGTVVLRPRDPADLAVGVLLAGAL